MRPAPTMADVIRVACEVCDISQAALLSDGKNPHELDVRAAVIVVGKKLGKTDTQVGNAINRYRVSRLLKSRGKKPEVLALAQRITIALSDRARVWEGVL